MGTFPAVYCANKAISGNPGYPAICERSESKSQYVRLAEDAKHPKAGRTEFHCENGMVLARRPHFPESDGISPEAWNFGYGFQDDIHYYAGGGTCFPIRS